MSRAEHDIVAEAERLLAAAHADDVPIRLIGGLAIYLHTEEIPPSLQRSYDDIDIATPKGASRSVGDFFAKAGYEPAREFNVLHGAQRLLFHDRANERKLDVFVGSFEMCHTIPITKRIELDDRTIPLAELLLTKLQVVELNDKDVRDIATLLHGHEVSGADGEEINGDFIASLTADDWGLWRTVKMNLERTHGQMGSLELDEATHARVVERADALWERIERAPKSRKWRVRDRVGDRKRWYEVPDEVRR